MIDVCNQGQSCGVFPTISYLHVASKSAHPKAKTLDGGCMKTTLLDQLPSSAFVQRGVSKWAHFLGSKLMQIVDCQRSGFSLSYVFNPYQSL